MEGHHVLVSLPKCRRSRRQCLETPAARAQFEITLMRGACFHADASKASRHPRLDISNVLRHVPSLPELLPNCVDQCSEGCDQTGGHQDDLDLDSMCERFLKRTSSPRL